MTRLLLAGYLGCGNFGDDALMSGLLEALDPAKYELAALSGRPEETFRDYRIQAYPRKDLRAVDEALSNCDALVFAGGSIFQDSTSTMSVAYYANLVHRAKKAGKKVVLLGQGIGPLTTFFGRRMALGAFNDCDAIAVRDPGSAAILRDFKVKPPVVVTADLALLMAVRPAEDGEENFTVGTMRTVGIAPRPLGKTFDSAALFGETCSLIYKSGVMPVLIAMDQNEDGPLIDAIAKIHGGRIPHLRKARTPDQIQARIARMDTVIAMRLHAGILATNVGVPPLMVNYDPKVAAFARLLGAAPAIPLENLTPDRLASAFSGFLAERDRYARLVVRQHAELRALAQKNVEVLETALARSSRK